MRQYLDLLDEVFTRGRVNSDRTGTGTYSIFGPQMRFDLQEGFPILTTKKMWFRGIVEELLWFLRGSTNIKDLPEDVQKLWDKWADEDGDLGPIYGEQFRHWKKYSEHVNEGANSGGEDKLTGDVHSECRNISGYREQVDQIAYVIKNIRENPQSRRHVMTTWNPADIPDMNLPPCHGIAIQFYVREEKELRTAQFEGYDYYATETYLDCKMYQRSADMFLGVPFNITSYSLLTTIIAYLTGYKPGQFIHTFGDAHIYQNHLEQVSKQLEREPYERPELEFSPDFDPDVPIHNLHSNSVDFEYNEDSIWHQLSFGDFNLKGYEHHPHISAPIAV